MCWFWRSHIFFLTNILQDTARSYWSHTHVWVLRAWDERNRSVNSQPRLTPQELWRHWQILLKHSGHAYSCPQFGKCVQDLSRNLELGFSSPIVLSPSLPHEHCACLLADLCTQCRGAFKLDCMLTYFLPWSNALYLEKQKMDGYDGSWSSCQCTEILTFCSQCSIQWSGPKPTCEKTSHQEKQKRALRSTPGRKRVSIGHQWEWGVTRNKLDMLDRSGFPFVFSNKYWIPGQDSPGKQTGNWQN